MTHLTKHRYVLGFAFDQFMRRVLLIEKEKPAWQKGKLNGVGGTWEPEELAIHGMTREFFEETGYETTPNQWVNIGYMEGADWYIEMFAALLNLDAIQTEEFSKTAEQLRVVTIENTHIESLQSLYVENVPWLVSAARDMLQDNRPARLKVIYP